MIPAEIIRKKRDGAALSDGEIRDFVSGYLDGRITDYQMSALLMAVFFRGMDFSETSSLTRAMLESGVVVDLAGVKGTKVDKHSTGGVGDKVSIILAPMVAACGVPVPMISGRGLGHTGGTLDKLESIPGFRTDLSLDEYRKAMETSGLVMIGQTKEIAPADKRMYALRDVTGTVESIPLIAGSIMSKKIAEGIDALVLDVKMGRGAFMQSEERAIELANTLIAVGNQFGKRTIGFITDMSQPLGFAVGNWLEMKECIECLKGRNVPDLMELTYVQGGAMVMLGGKAASIGEGMDQCREAIGNGSAWKAFENMVNRQGGDARFINEPDLYAKPRHAVEIRSSLSGDIDSIDALEIGYAGILLGAGRMKVGDSIDPRAGIILRKKVGDIVSPGDVLAVLYADDEEKISEAVQRVERAFTIGEEPSPAPPLILSIIDENGARKWQPDEVVRKT